MKISLIAAVANNHVIGADNRLLWHLPADLRYFKQRTMGHTVIMGRKTFDSIGKPLPGRRNIVITQKKGYEAPGCEVAYSVEEALKMAGKCEEVFVVGGAEIYHQTIDLPYTHTLYITRIFATFEGDAFFPNVDPKKWQLIKRVDRKADEKNKYDITFLTYKRRKR